MNARKFFLVILLIMVFPLVGEGRSEQNGLALLLKADKDVYVVGEGIMVEAFIVNSSSVPMTIDGRKFIPVFKLTHERVGEIDLGQVVTQRTVPMRDDFVVLSPGQEIFLGKHNLVWAEDKPYTGKFIMEGALEFIFYGHEYGLKAFVGKLEAKPISIKRVWEGKIAAQMTSSQVKELADTYARNEGFKLDEYQDPMVDYDAANHEWSVFYDQIPSDSVDPATGEVVKMGVVGKHFTVVIDDNSGKSRLVRGL